MNSKFTTLSVVSRTLALCLVLGSLASANAQSHWEVKPSNSTASLNAVAFGNGIFVAVGDNGSIVTSPDGNVWTARVSGTTDRLPAIAFGNGRFVATRANRNNPALTSVDGVNWASVVVTNSSGAPVECGAWDGIAFGGGRFMAVGAINSISSEVMTSTNGTAFQQVIPAHYPAPLALDVGLKTITFFRGEYYGTVGYDGVYSTSDGIGWKRRQDWGGSVGTNPPIITTDGISKISVITDGPLPTFSIDAGHTFRRAGSPSTRITGACYGAGRYVAVDYRGQVWTSETDGEYWHPRDRYAQSGEEFRSVAFDGVGRFIAVGSAPSSGSALIAVAQADPPPPVGPGYTVYSLKDMTNGVFNGRARAISNTGIIAGSITGSNNATIGAILRDGVVTTYPDPVYHSYPTSVTSVNDSGTAALEVNVGSSLNIGVALPQQSRTFPGGGIYSTAASTNTSGWIVGTYRSYDGATRGIYRYNPNTDERVDLGNFGLKNIEATSINESGDIAGRYVYGTGPFNQQLVGPFRLSAGGQLIPIPMPPGPSATNIVINSHGDVAGSTDIATQGHAFLFKDGISSNIDFGSSGSAVWGLNNKGDVVGYFNAINTAPWQSLVGNALLYHDGMPYDLNRLLDQSGDGWILREAIAINDNGWIVGDGYRHGFYREPFLAIPNGGKPAESQTRFVNLSTRARAGVGDDAVIAGFVLRGGAKKVVIRAIGPSQPSSGSRTLPNPLPDPTLELFNDRGERVEFNDNFTDYPYFPFQNEVGVYGLAPWSSLSVIRDSVIMTTLPEGSYTAVVRGLGGTSGNCLVEIYNIDPDYSAGLVNIATRGPVGTGDDVMIAGFIIRGDRERRVLIRGIGPSLGAAGVANPLGDPMLEIYDANGQIASNDDWRTAQEGDITAAGFAPGNDRDAAIILSLWPGTYTAIVRGKAGMTGNAIVEVYTLPD